MDEFLPSPSHELSDAEIRETSISNDSIGHPVQLGFGAMLGGGTAGAAGGMLFGPLGVIVGIIAGTVSGVISSRAISEMVRRENEVGPEWDAYVTRPQHPSDREEPVVGDSKLPIQASTSRECWTRLDETNKDLLVDRIERAAEVCVTRGPVGSHSECIVNDNATSSERPAAI